jgi:hypothetical protein
LDGPSSLKRIIASAEAKANNFHSGELTACARPSLHLPPRK